jgi:serine/threonine protein kinase
LGAAIELGKYQIQKIIAHGGMGTVYLAQHQMLKRPTAIKVIRMDNQTDDAAKRFEREVKLASQLTHPNTIEIFDYGLTDSQKAYCAMEYLVGLNLKEVVERNHGALPVGRVVHILKQVCASLLEAHTLGLVHRDIKPQNIMLLNKIGLHDFVKVLDFGLAKPFASGANPDETKAITGTPVYLSPERLKKPGLADPEADIYAVGALSYYLLSGTPIFSFSSDLDVLYRILNEDPENLPEEVPKDIARLTMMCLEKEPENRPADMAELKAFLDVLGEKYPWPAEDAAEWWKKNQN